MSKALVKFENVWKYYPLYHHIIGGFKAFLFNLPKAVKQLKNNKFLALKNINFEIERGETFCIIGNNGSGKSTILGLIAEVMKPSSGKVIVNGRVSPLLELGAGFHPELTGMENIILNGVLLGLTRNLILKKVEDIIHFSGIESSIYQPVRTYSSGMIARLGFSVIAHLEPEILLIDEILAVGDIDFQQKCLNKILEFKKKGVTIVFVSHSLEDVKRIGDRAMWIEGHQIKMIGDVCRVVEKYASPRIA